MGTVQLPDPVVRHPDHEDLDARALAAALRERVAGEVRFDGHDAEALSET